jgi:hypothetical protein
MDKPVKVGGAIASAEVQANGIATNHSEGLV